VRRTAPVKWAQNRPSVGARTVSMSSASSPPLETKTPAEAGVVEQVASAYLPVIGIMIVPRSVTLFGISIRLLVSSGAVPIEAGGVAVLSAATETVYVPAV
jgi:hypothetical protein